MRDLTGESGCAVWRLTKAGTPDLYLKHAAGRFVHDLVDEYARLEWLSGRMPVPSIRSFLRLKDEAWLLMSALPGLPAEQLFDAHPEGRAELTRTLVNFMSQLHALPPEDCPFEAGVNHRLASARRNIDAGLVDEGDFDPEREGWTTNQVWDALQAELPLSGARVVTHGDFSLGNLLIADGAVSGFIDVGRVGLADPYQDLAILWNCLRDYGTDLADLLWPSYGLAAPDERRLLAHLLLDELF
jgi:aminoglycoside 3'-phosphotransferase I